MSCSWPAKVFLMLLEAMSQTCVVSLDFGTRIKNTTNSDQLVFRTSSEISPIRTEANTPDVQITNSINRLVLKNANLLSRSHIKDLCRSVATSRDVFSVVAESDAAHNTLVRKCPNEIYIKNSWNFWVEDGKPI